jgi:hypothetical protein
VLFTLAPIPAAVACLADPLGKAGTPGLGLLVVAIPWFLLGIYWIKKRTRKRAEVSAVRAASYKRAQEIVAEAGQLTSSPAA